MVVHGSLEKGIQYFHAGKDPLVLCIVHELFPAQFQYIAIGTVCHVESHVPALRGAGIDQAHGGPQGNAVEPDGYLRILLPEQSHPAVHVFRIVDSPVIGIAAAFPMAPDIRHQHIVSPGQVNPGIGNAHGPILVQTVEQDDGFMAS